MNKIMQYFTQKRTEVSILQSTPTSIYQISAN